MQGKRLRIKIDIGGTEYVVGFPFQIAWVMINSFIIFTAKDELTSVNEPILK